MGNLSAVIQDMTGGVIDSYVTFLVIITGVQIASFFTKRLAGFGDSLVYGPVFSIFMDNRIISPSSACMSFVANGYMVAKNYKSIKFRQVSFVLPPMFAGVILGTLMLRFGESWIIKLGLGILIILLGVEMFTRPKEKKLNINKVAVMIVCFFSGITSGLYSINLLFVAYLERSTSGREAFRGGLSIVFLCENIFRIIIYIISGFIGTHVLILTISSLPGMIIGFFLGSMVDDKLSERAVSNLAVVVFILSGLSIVIKTIFTRI